MFGKKKIVICVRLTSSVFHQTLHYCNIILHGGTIIIIIITIYSLQCSLFPLTYDNRFRG